MVGLNILAQHIIATNGPMVLLAITVSDIRCMHVSPRRQGLFHDNYWNAQPRDCVFPIKKICQLPLEVTILSPKLSICDRVLLFLACRVHGFFMVISCHFPTRALSSQSERCGPLEPHWDIQRILHKRISARSLSVNVRQHIRSVIRRRLQQRARSDN
jgi:hypothetical protein